MPIVLTPAQARLLWFAFLLSTLETALFLIGRAVEREYGLIYGALLMFGFNFLLLLSYRRAD
jgi:hypothetical protein